MSRYNEVCNSDLKKFINTNLVLYGNLYLKNFNKCLILDGKDMITTSILLKYQVYKRNIFIPEIDEVTRKIHVKSNKCVSWNGTIESFIRSNDMKDFNFGFFDYTGFETGNKTCRPMGDIYEFISRTHHDTIIIGATFCARAESVRLYGSDNLETQIHEDFMFPMIKYAQFKILYMIAPYRYIRNKLPMIFFMYVLKKDMSINNKNIEFIIKNGKFQGYWDDHYV